MTFKLFASRHTDYTTVEGLVLKMSAHNLNFLSSELFTVINLCDETIFSFNRLSE